MTTRVEPLTVPVVLDWREKLRVKRERLSFFGIRWRKKIAVPFLWVWRTVRTQETIEREEVLFVGSLVLIGWSLWDVYRPAAIGVPALFLLWVTLPPRPPFFDREPRGKKKRRV